MRKGTKMSLESREKLSNSHKSRYENGKANRKIFNRQKDGRWVVNCRNGERVFWYHIIYQNVYLNGKEIPKGFCIHHKDGNPENDDPENLEMLTKTEHMRIHQIKRMGSPEYKKMVGKWNKGKTHSSETKEKMSKSQKGKIISEEHKKRISQAQIGKPKSEEHRKNISDTLKVILNTPEAKKRSSECQLGKKHSEEHKEKISEAIKEWWKTRKSFEEKI